jgi:hypothetical protein
VRVSADDDDEDKVEDEDEDEDEGSGISIPNCESDMALGSGILSVSLATRIFRCKGTKLNKQRKREEEEKRRKEDGYLEALWNTVFFQTEVSQNLEALAEVGCRRMGPIAVSTTLAISLLLET